MREKEQESGWWQFVALAVASFIVFAFILPNHPGIGGAICVCVIGEFFAAKACFPGGDLVVAGAQATISVASGVKSAVHGDGIGSALGVLGLPATFTSYAAKAISVGGKALPGVGAVVSGLGALNDAY